MMPPITRPMVTAETLTTSDTRAACTTRESWSRPSESAPSGCSAEKPAKRSITLGRLGSGSGSRVAKIAQNTTVTSQATASQKATPFFPPARRNRQRRRARGPLPAGAGMTSRDGSSSTPRPRTRSAASSSGCSAAIANPRVENRVEDVDDEVDDDEGDGDHQGAPLDHDEVSLEDGVNQQPTHPGQGEQRLDDHRPADDGGHLQTDHGHQRERAGSQGVAKQDPRSRDALG